jgi:hypothetical protein
MIERRDAIAALGCDCEGDVRQAPDIGRLDAKDGQGMQSAPVRRLKRAQ